jgi:HEAT repeat protein
MSASTAADALGRFAGQPGGEQAVAPLVALLKDPDLACPQSSAAGALGRFAGQPGAEHGHRPAGPPAHRTRKSKVRGSAAGALGGFAGQTRRRSRPSLRWSNLLKDPEPEVRNSAAGALGRFAGHPGGEQAVAPLVDLLKDPDQHVRAAAADALGRFAGQPGSRTGRRTAGRPAQGPGTSMNAQQRDHASSAALPGSPVAEQAVAPLVHLLTGPGIRRSASSAASALGGFAAQSGSEQAVAPLVTLLKDPDLNVRSSAAGALGALAAQPGGEQAVGPLVNLLKDPEPEGPQQRGRRPQPPSPGSPGGEQAVAPLVHLLTRTRKSKVRNSAAGALGGFAGQTRRRSRPSPRWSTCSQDPEVEGPQQRGWRPRRLCRADPAAITAVAPLVHLLTGPEVEGPQQRGWRPRRLCRADPAAITAVAPLVELAQGPGTGGPQQRGRRPPRLCRAPRRRTGRRSADGAAHGPGGPAWVCPRKRSPRPRRLCRAARRRTGRRPAGRPAQGPGAAVSATSAARALGAFAGHPGGEQAVAVLWSTCSRTRRPTIPATLRDQRNLTSALPASSK